MIRFVDLRYQGVGARFAFWDTVRDRFEIWLGFQAWDTWAAFESDCVLGFPREGESVKTALARRRALCPPWAFEPPTDEELGFREGAAESEELRLLREVEPPTRSGSTRRPASGARESTTRSYPASDSLRASRPASSATCSAAPQKRKGRGR